LVTLTPKLDELKQKWTEHDRKLDQSIRLNRQLLRETYTRRARVALWRLAAMPAVGSIFMLSVIVSLGRFIALNWWAPRFVFAALAALNAQIGLALNINYNQPVAVIQKPALSPRSCRL
jgi:hypothetical protein